MYKYTSGCLEVVCDLPLLPSNTASEKFLHKSGVVLTGYLSLWRRPGVDWASTWQWKKLFKIIFSNSKQKQLQVLPNLLPHRIARQGLNWNIIRLRSNYTVIIIIFNNNNVIITNNLRKAVGDYFVLQNLQWYAKEFLRNFQTIWAWELKKFRQPWPREWKDRREKSYQLPPHNTERKNGWP